MARKGPLEIMADNLNIPAITNDRILANVISELRYKLKSSIWHNQDSVMVKEFAKLIDEYSKRHGIVEEIKT